MARKKIEPIISLGNEDKLTVQKSLPLFALWRSDLTLAEFKILDTYLSRIDSHKPEKRTVIFEKGELEKLLGVKRIKTEELDERLKHLGTPIRLDDNTAKNKRFARISLFEKAFAEQDDYGLWQVELTASQSAMKYFFNIENLGYLRYKLRCITSITSRYTYIMFIYLEANRFRKSWEVPLNELKEILSCDKEELYKEYKFFNQKLLKRVQKEMNEKTECRYSYEPIKKGRSVVAIRFTVETLPMASIEEVDENQITIDQWQAETNKETELWQKPLEPFNFTAEEYEELSSVFVTVPDSVLPQSAACPGSIDLMRYHYMDQMAKEIIRRDQQTPIRNKFAYLLKSIRKDAGV
ncbi:MULTISPECIES: replication initiation protein [unclassified Candidatus Paralachnospira]|uniref:replication initiation protein n=1 Tax=unclassified Candidatus Paralachnospira TaxID=3099471 RepID=UPI003F909190